MATLSIVNYNNKLNILQPSLNVNNNDKREIIIMRKKQKILPAPASDKPAIVANNVQKERKTKTQPMAVARRNARERNRVKLVNDGFATLRQHIPAEIAAAFENSGRGGSKKLSKVETLRMAVEYIRSLEYLLSDGLEGNENTSYNYPSTESSYVDYQQSPPMEDDDYSNPSTSPTMQQYEHIPTTHTYQIISPTGYENDENLRPEQTQILLSDNMIGQNFGYIIDASISDDYSEQSMSPINLENTHINKYINTLDSHCYTGQIMLKEESEDIEQSVQEDREGNNHCFTGQIMLKTESPEHAVQTITAGEDGEAVRQIILNDDIDIQCYKRQIMLKNEMEAPCFTGQIMLKKEMDDVDDMMLEDNIENTIITQDPNEMMDVMNWWKQEQTLQT